MFYFFSFFLFLLDWAVDCECWYMEWLQRWSETQRTLLATGGKRRPLWSMCVRTKSVKKKKTKKNNVKYEQVLVCAAGARNCYTPLSLPLYPSLCFRCVWVLRLHHGDDLRALPGRLLWQRSDWHSWWLSALPLPGPHQLFSNCGDRTGGLYQLPCRTDRWDDHQRCSILSLSFFFFFLYGTTQ